MEGSTHKQVVDLIKSCGDSLVLTVISVSPEEAERLEPTGTDDIPIHFRALKPNLKRGLGLKNCTLKLIVMQWV